MQQLLSIPLTVTFRTPAFSSNNGRPSLVAKWPESYMRSARARNDSGKVIESLGMFSANTIIHTIQEMRLVNLDHSITANLISGRPQDGAFALFSTVPSTKAAILPDKIPFTEGVVVPFALEAAVCALCLKIPGIAFPGVSTPALGLPYPSVDLVPSLDKTIIIYGGSPSVGSMASQLATAAGVHVISIVGKHIFGFSKTYGPPKFSTTRILTLSKKSSKPVASAPERSLIGIFDVILSPETYARDLAILERLGGGHLACVHPPSAKGIPNNVQAGMIFVINNIVEPMWRDFVMQALESGKLKCLPQTVVGKGLESINDGLKRSKAGASATKLVVTL